MAIKGRNDANETAGEVIPFHNSKSKVKDIAGVPAPDKKVVAPLFNLVRTCVLDLSRTAT